MYNYLRYKNNALSLFFTLMRETCIKLELLKSLDFSKTPYGIPQTTFYRTVSKVQQLNSSSKVGDRSRRACETLSRLVFSTCTGMTIAIGDSNRL